MTLQLQTEEHEDFNKRPIFFQHGTKEPKIQQFF